MELSKIKPEIPDYIKYALEKLEKSGFEAYIVGGAVRDIIMGKKPDDYDITTSALPDEIINLFRNKRIITTGIKHGTVAVIIEHKAVEITTYRIDGNYNDMRHPDSVSFSDSIEQDLSRRDFTVNAICYNENKGFIDPFIGKNDIDKKIITAVGNPDKRFSEDALRVFRAIRFCSVLDFEMNNRTELAAFKYAAFMREVSRERIFTEFKKLLSGKAAARVLNTYLYIILCADKNFAEVLGNGCDPVVFDEIDNCSDNMEEKLATFIICLNRAEKDIVYSDSSLLKSELLHKNQDNVPEICLASDKLLNSLKCDKSTINKVKQLLKFFYLPLPTDRADIKRICAILNDENLQSLCRLKKAFLKDKSKLCEIDGFISMSFECRKECISLKTLEVNGNDLLNAGIKNNDIGKALDFLLNSVIEEKIENEKTALLGKLEEFCELFN